MKQATTTQASQKAEIIFLGIDVHLNKYVVVRQVDGLTPQPAQCFRLKERLLDWVAKQYAKAERVVCCYEAGPLGFVLCRDLHAMGVVCHVIAPKKWAENDNQVKTDKRDARILCQRLESYERGNREVFNVLRVPTLAEEHYRSLSRQRQALKKEVQRNAQRGRGQALNRGFRLKGRWWSKRRWESICCDDKNLAILLRPLRTIIVVIEKELGILTKQLKDESVRPEERPKGFGALSWRIIHGEICDFSRFNNRRQVSSYTGLCPREYSSGQTRRQGSISKNGNPLLREYLVETAWRLTRYQPEWYAMKKWHNEFAAASKGRRKQIVVALARTLAVDLWRLETKQTTLEKLGFTSA